MKYFDRSAFISHSNIYNSVSVVTGMNEFLTVLLPTVAGNGLIHWCQAFINKNFCSLSEVMLFIIFNVASFFLFSKILLQLFPLTKQAIVF